MIIKILGIPQNLHDLLNNGVKNTTQLLKFDSRVWVYKGAAFLQSQGVLNTTWSLKTGTKIYVSSHQYLSFALPIGHRGKRHSLRALTANLGLRVKDLRKYHNCLVPDARSGMHIDEMAAGIGSAASTRSHGISMLMDRGFQLLRSNSPAHMQRSQPSPVASQKQSSGPFPPLYRTACPMNYRQLLIERAMMETDADEVVSMLLISAVLKFFREW